MKEIESWISEENLAKIYTSNYWNDIEQEKKKEWWISDGNYDKCLEFLNNSGLLSEYYIAESEIKDYFKNSLEKIQVLDIAAGIGWTSALLSKLQNVSNIHALEISRHRLSELFEHSFKMLSGDNYKVSRYLGSFYDIKLPDNSIDLVFMAQAFHHADQPFKLLSECDKVLKKGGVIALIGEDSTGIYQIIRRFFSCLIKEGKIKFNFYQLFDDRNPTGDHHYRKTDYYFILQGYGYEVSHKITTRGKTIYFAKKI